MDSRDTLSSTAEGVLGSPVQNLIATLIYVAIVFVLSTCGYVAAGWHLPDAIYMVTLTIFSVGYGEVHPIDTEYLRMLTIATIVFGCIGMIVLTGALVQVFTLFQVREMLGINRVQSQIDRLERHVIICGFGRIGVQLARELELAKRGFVIIERGSERIAEAQSLGYLCLAGDATEESALMAAGIDRARVLATVLPDDAANVFITLSARSLNEKLEIIARGEVPTTERKLFHAGADKVVLPTHIGAERIAEMILYPSTDQFVEDSAHMKEMKRGLHEFGLQLEAVTVTADSAIAGERVGDAERRGHGGFFVVQIDRANGRTILHPGEDVGIEAGDNVILVVRGSRVSAGSIFTAPAGPIKVGRTSF